MVAPGCGFEGQLARGRSATRGRWSGPSRQQQKQPAQHGIRQHDRWNRGCFQPRPDRGIERCLRDDGSMRPVIGPTAYVEPARWVAWNTDAALLHAWYPGGGDPFRGFRRCCRLSRKQQSRWPAESMP